MDLPFRVGISKFLKIRGIIATRNIQKGEVIERCPVILVPKKEEPHLFATVLKKYYFEWTKTHHSVVLGYGALINHSYNPNAGYRHDYHNTNIVYFALKDIGEGEELLINYNWDPNDKHPVDDFLEDFNKHMS